MRRADRLFQLILMLGGGKIVTGDRLAERLGVSKRTVYRDFKDLSASGVPIEGEAGVGFRLRPGYQVPPLMFTTEELQALVFGARMVRSCADDDLRAAASSLLAKVDAVLPVDLKPLMEDTGLLVPDFRVSSEVKQNLKKLRDAVSQRRRVGFEYTRSDGALVTTRARPLCLRYVGGTWTLGAWSEFDEAFRTFRVYRIAGLEISPETFIADHGRALSGYLAAVDDPRTGL